MSKIIITGGTVLTINDADDVHFGGHVVLDGDRIAAVGEGAYQGPVGDGDQVIDAAGKIVMPGLIDLHYHTAIAKGFSDHLPLWEYLDACWYPFIRTLDADAAYWSAAASYLESIKCGVTTVNDMYRRLPDLGRRRARHRHPGGAVQRRGAARAQPGHAAGQPGRLRRGARPGQRPHRGVRGHRVAAAGLPGTAPRRPGAGRRAGHRHPHPPERVADRGGEQQAAVRAAAHRGRLRRRAARPPTAWPRTACGCPTPRSR